LPNVYPTVVITRVKEKSCTGGGVAQLVEQRTFNNFQLTVNTQITSFPWFTVSRLPFAASRRPSLRVYRRCKKEQRIGKAASRVPCLYDDFQSGKVGASRVALHRRFRLRRSATPRSHSHGSADHAAARVPGRLSCQPNFA
jgi:hypothetical protein